MKDSAGDTVLSLQGDWVQGLAATDFAPLRDKLMTLAPRQLVLDGSELGRWDSVLMALLLQLHDYCRDQGIDYRSRAMPASVDRLLEVATAVPAREAQASPAGGFWQSFHPGQQIAELLADLRESLAFLGDMILALGRLLTGRARTRFSDYRLFCFQSGPDAFAIISLTSVLVGMILAYLGAVQLAQFGAQIYVADLVVIGMLREMGALMTAVVMAGRTGAAYAAQLGTMQTNEEIDAIRTLGISPMDFLVLPRMLALVTVMPLLTIYANVLGVMGGGLIAGGMGISPLAYLNEGASVLQSNHLMAGLIKSLVFAVLIAVAGCRSGINSGRSSAAVGEAATEAVVTAIVYLIVADAAINILFQQLEF
jgi:phospholipid/cholesterol/gamma-HCH transport system permease protein